MKRRVQIGDPRLPVIGKKMRREFEDRQQIIFLQKETEKPEKPYDPLYFRLTPAPDYLKTAGGEHF